MTDRETVGMTDELGGINDEKGVAVTCSRLVPSFYLLHLPPATA